jgi:hypothetical protein
MKVHRNVVLAHEQLTEMTIHDHVRHYDRAIDSNAWSDFVLKPLLLRFGVEAEILCILLHDQRNPARARVKSEPRHTLRRRYA